MTKKKFLRVSFLIAVTVAASGCSVFKKGKGPSTPVLGERIAVLTGEGDVTADPATAALPMSLPQASVGARFRAEQQTHRLRARQRSPPPSRYLQQRSAAAPSPAG